LKTLSELQSEFESAVSLANEESIASVLKDFDQYCKQQLEETEEPEQKRILLNRLLNIQTNWKSEILQLKAKVNDNLADIKMNAKKINKYLTSY
jgi:small nuclear ribonucleoprotein (snRNP)-like protein